MFLSQNEFPRFTGENLEKNKILYSKLANLAEKHACATPQLALAWLLHQGDDIIPIPGIIDPFNFFFLHVINLIIVLFITMQNWAINNYLSGLMYFCFNLWERNYNFSLSTSTCILSWLISIVFRHVLRFLSHGWFFFSLSLSPPPLLMLYRYN